MRRFYPLILAGMTMMLSGSTCIWPNVSEDRPAALKSFSSEQELRDYFVEQATAQQNGYTRADGLGSFWDMVFDMAPTAVSNEADTTGSTSETNVYSTTNIQEAGVDESDVVKNDGQYIYRLAGNRVYIVQATPVSELSEIARIELQETGQALYLQGNRLVVLSQKYAYGYGDVAIASVEVDTATNSTEPVTVTDDTTVTTTADPQTTDSADSNFWSGKAQTTVTVIDVSDPAQPATEATLKLEGTLASSRMIGSKLHVVLSTWPTIAIPLANTTASDWIPDYELTTADGQDTIGDMAGWQAFYRPEAADGYTITTVVTLDVDHPTDPFASTAITANAGTIYASTEALYITDTDYGYDSPTLRSETIIHKLAFTDVGTDYIASGKVPGRILNSYSLGEYNGYLRIATTEDDWGWMNEGSSLNNVYVLSPNGISLEVVGKVEKLAPGETIYAARFIGTRGFLVTFKRIDPLFVLDMSEPTNPTVAGELKVPGYSDHLQLMDDNHLLTIGKDVQDAGDFAWVQGVQLSIFDISDASNPTLLHKQIIGGRGTTSEANYEPKAFNYFKERDALALPIDLYSEGTTGAEYGTHEFTGLYVYHVTVEDGFSLLGRISTREETSLNCWWWYWSGATRSVFINDHVYSVTDRGVKSAPLNAVDAVDGQVQYSNVTAITDDCGEIMPMILPDESNGLE